MTQRYGSPIPSLAQQITFAACVAGTNASSVVINVTYLQPGAGEEAFLQSSSSANPHPGAR